MLYAHCKNIKQCGKYKERSIRFIFKLKTFFMAAQLSMWDFNSPTRDQTCIESTVS